MNGDERPPLIPPGIYDLAFVSYETKSMFRGKANKLYLHFKVMDMGPAFEAELVAYYNLQWVNGKKWKVGFKSNFLRDYVRLFDEVPDRLDRIPMTRFKEHLIKAKVKTVTHGADQKPIHKLLQYSVIQELIELNE